MVQWIAYKVVAKLPRQPDGGDVPSPHGEEEWEACCMRARSGIKLQMEVTHPVLHPVANECRRIVSHKQVQHTRRPP
jgi:hypothetical protein